MIKANKKNINFGIEIPIVNIKIGVTIIEYIK